MRSRLVRAAWIAPTALALLTACGGQGLTPAAEGTSSSAPVDVSVSDCGSGWSPGPAGPQTLVLHNADSRPGEVRVIGVGSLRGQVYADVEPFGPDTTVGVTVPLAAGRYALSCLMEDEAPITGPAHTIAGTGRGTPGVRTVTQSRLVPATQRYERWLKVHVQPLVRDTARLRTDVVDGDRPAARRDWLAAHLDYQRLGAAYEAFGDLGDRIDGLPQGLPRGTANPHWTGFHRVERDLWRGSSSGRLVADAETLSRAAARLPALMRSAQLDPGTVVIRAHEIDENALQFQLTGADDFGSHTDLASVRAELVGTRAVLHSLWPLIMRRVSDGAAIRGALRVTSSEVTSAARRYAGVPVVRLPRQTRERLDASLSLLCARLADVPATLEPRLADASATGGGR